MFYFSSKFNFPVPQQLPFSALLNGLRPWLVTLYKLDAVPSCCEDAFILLKSVAQCWFHLQPVPLHPSLSSLILLVFHR